MVAGAVLLVGEILAAVVYFVATRNSLRVMQGGISMLPVVFSLLQVGAMGAGIAVGISFPASSFLSALVAVCFVLAAGLIQWAYLENDVKRRVLSLVAKVV